jgi:hypothetical protein
VTPRRPQASPGLRRPDAALASLVRAHLAADENEETARLIADLRAARRRGHLTLRELEAVCRWKSPRAIRYVLSNPPAEVREATRLALRSRDEERRVTALLALKGVSIPMASAVLTLLHPRRYGVIDIRVWQMLHRGRYVSGSPGGVGLRVPHWLQFLAVVRDLSAGLGATARRVEMALFEIHRARQRGALYARPRSLRQRGLTRPRSASRHR